MNELKPCPFCGEENIEIQTLNLMPEGFVRCKSCGVTMYRRIACCYKWRKKLVDGLIKAWNRRVNQNE